MPEGRPSGARSRPRAAAARSVPAPAPRRAGSSRRVGQVARPSRRSSRVRNSKPVGVRAARALDVLVVVERGERRGLGDQVHVERMPRALEVAGELAVGDGVADAQPGEAVDLREGAQHARAGPPAHPGEARPGSRAAARTRRRPRRSPAPRPRAARPRSDRTPRAPTLVPVGLFGLQTITSARARRDRGAHRVEVVHEVGVERDRAPRSRPCPAPRSGTSRRRATRRPPRRSGRGSTSRAARGSRLQPRAEHELLRRHVEPRRRAPARSRKHAPSG